MRRITFLLIFAALFVTGCKSTARLASINTGDDADWSGDLRYQVVVLTRLYSPQLRQLFEEEMTKALIKEGVSAIPGYTIIPNVASINQEAVQAMMAQGQDVALLFTEAATVNRTESSANTGDVSLFSKLMRGGGVDWETEFSVIFESGLYVNGQDSAVWWNRTKLEAKENQTKDAVARFVKNEIRLMKKSGVIERLK